MEWIFLLMTYLPIVSIIVGLVLLNACIEDSKNKGKMGLCILAAAKKKPYLADPKFLKHKEFQVCDEADNGIQLWYLPFDESATMPQFKECAKYPHTDEMGYVLYYTSQCPFNAKYVPIIEGIAKEKQLTLDEALAFFYQSQVYELMREGCSDMHCMSDLYLVEELRKEYQLKDGK